METAKVFIRDAEVLCNSDWGGLDIPVGIYKHHLDSIATACGHTISHMASLIQPITSTTRILHMGAGYGMTARYLARTYGCQVWCLSLSRRLDEWSTAITKDAGLDGLVKIVGGTFENVSCEMDYFDIVWSQDAFFQAGNKAAIAREIRRVTKEGGRVIFTDIMHAYSIGRSDTLWPISEEWNLRGLGDPESYCSVFEEAGFSDAKFENLTRKMIGFYNMIMLEFHEDQLQGKITEEQVKKMQDWADLCIEGGMRGLLCWGVLQYRRRLPGDYRESQQETGLKARSGDFIA